MSMKKAFRSLLTFHLPNLAFIAVLAFSIALGAIAAGVPQGADNLFRNYYLGFPFMVLMALYMLSFNLCTTNLNLVLSFGCRRRDYFVAFQLIVAAYTLTSTLICALLAALPRLQGWVGMEQWSMLFTNGLSVALFPLLCICMMGLGTLCGLIFLKNRILGMILILVGMLVSGLIMMIFLLIMADWRHIPLWGSLPAVLVAIFVAVAVLCEFFSWRHISRYCVR